MSRKLTLTIPGNPIAKHRPRFARRGKFVSTYNDQETEEGRWILEARQQLTDRFKEQGLMTGPIVVVMTFDMARPKAHYGTGKNAGKLKPSAPTYDTRKKNDIDNLEKFAFDCLNGLAWEDDCQVVEVTKIKQYSEDPKTVLYIREVEP